MKVQARRCWASSPLPVRLGGSCRQEQALPGGCRRVSASKTRNVGHIAKLATGERQIGQMAIKISGQAVLLLWTRGIRRFCSRGHCP